MGFLRLHTLPPPTRCAPADNGRTLELSLRGVVGGVYRLDTACAATLSNSDPRAAPFRAPFVTSLMVSLPATGRPPAVRAVRPICVASSATFIVAVWKYSCRSTMPSPLKSCATWRDGATPPSRTVVGSRRAVAFADHP